VRLTQANVDLLKAAQRMLLRLGINSAIYSGRIAAQYRELPDGHGGLKPYWCQELHEMVISGSNVAEFSRRVGLLQPSKRQRLDALLACYKRELNRDWFDDEVVTIELIGEEPVFDVTVPGVHEFCASGIQAIG
jgi:ribonucleoside-diphosphate reductase alpha chain